MERKIQEIELPGGERMLARVSVLEAHEMPGAEEFAYEDVGALDHMTARIDQLNELVRGVGTAVLEAAHSVRPTEVSATFGVELAMKPGKAVALLADGEAKASLSITLTWQKEAAVTALPAVHSPDGGTGDASGSDPATV
jgi:hypothetical protein